MQLLKGDIRQVHIPQDSSNRICRSHMMHKTAVVSASWRYYSCSSCSASSKVLQLAVAMGGTALYETCIASQEESECVVLLLTVYMSVIQLFWSCTDCFVASLGIKFSLINQSTCQSYFHESIRCVEYMSLSISHPCYNLLITFKQIPSEWGDKLGISIFPDILNHTKGFST